MIKLAHIESLFGRVLVLIQILALVVFSHSASLIEADASIFDQTLIGVSAHHHGGIDGQIVHAHDHPAVNSSSGFDSGSSVNSAMHEDVICHPCCIADIGSCAAIVSMLRKFSKPKATLTLDVSRLMALSSHQIAPQPHPPKNRS